MRTGPIGRPPMAPRDIPRLFVAIPIPEQIAAEVGAVIADVDGAVVQTGHRVRWVQIEGLHITVRFLGPTPKTQIETVAAAVRRAAVAVPGPFPISLGGAGGFPDAERPRALWIGIRSGAEALAGLSDALTTELVADGWSLDARPFRPHLTIARTDGVPAAADACRLLEASAADLDFRFTADHVVLYRSHLGHGPARYEVLERVPLG